MRGERFSFKILNKNFVFLFVYACSIIYLTMRIGQYALTIDLKTYCGGKSVAPSPGCIETNCMAASVIVGKQLCFIYFLYYHTS